MTSALATNRADWRYVADAPSRAETAAEPERVAFRAIALKAALSEDGVALGGGEGDLLAEWLDRLSRQP